MCCEMAVSLQMCFDSVVASTFDCVDFWWEPSKRCCGRR